jgi:uncharacterized repeat protein (TIGR01451 family)
MNLQGLKQKALKLTLGSAVLSTGVGTAAVGYKYWSRDAAKAEAAANADTSPEAAPAADNDEAADAPPVDPFAKLRNGGAGRGATYRGQSEDETVDDAFDRYADYGASDVAADDDVALAEYDEEVEEDSEVAFVEEADEDEAPRGSRYRRRDAEADEQEPADEEAFDAEEEVEDDAEAIVATSDLDEQPQRFDAGPATELQPDDEDEYADEPIDDETDAGAETPFDRQDAAAGVRDPFDAATERAGRYADAADSAASSGLGGQGRPGNRTLEGPQAASVTIERFAPEEIQVGRPTTFEIHVANVGQAPAIDVHVRDQVPEGTRLVGTTPQAELGPSGDIDWSLGTLNPGEDAVLKLDLLPEAEGEIGSVAQVYFGAEASVRTLATRPLLAIDASAPPDVLIGESVRLRVRVSNPGTGVATAVLVAATLPDSLQHEAGESLEYDVGDLAPGEVRDLELLLTAAKAGTAHISLVAEDDGNLQIEGQTEVEVLAPELKLVLEGSKRRYLEREATYTLTIANPGTAPAREVELATYLPEGMQFVKADNYGEYDPQTRAIRWSLAELPPGESGSVTLTALPTSTGDQTILIEGEAERGLRARQEQTIQVEGVAALKFEVVDVSDPIEVGGETTYEIHVVNQGSKASGGIVLNVLLPAGLEAIDAEGPTRHRLDAARVLFESLAELAPKADTTFYVTVKGTAIGDQRITVQLSSDELTEPVSKEESTQVLE